MANCRSLQLPQAKKGPRKLPALETTWVGATQNIINKNNVKDKAWFALPEIGVSKQKLHMSVLL
jgi:hypothetical protein